MALDDAYTITRPGQENGTGDPHALHIEEFTGLVQGTLDRMSVCAPRIPVRPVKGTSTITNFAVGKSTLQKITPGQPIDGTVNKFGKASMVIDTTIIARAVLPLLETFQTSYDARAEIAQEHGKELAKQFDQAFFIQAVKAGLLTANRYGLTAAGHTGGSQVVMGASGDISDPAALYSKIVDLLTALRLKDVDPLNDGVIIAVGPTEFATLSMNELLIDSTYVTSDGTNIPGMVLKSQGCAIVQSNNFVNGQVISGNLLSNSDNGNAYDGDFSKIVAAAFAPKALMAGETIPLQSEIFFDKLSKQWFIDSWRAYGVAPSAAAFAGVVELP
jgi:hypothetical protein